MQLVGSFIYLTPLAMNNFNLSIVVFIVQVSWILVRLYVALNFLLIHQNGKIAFIYASVSCQ